MSRPPPVKRVRFSESHVQVFEPPQSDSSAPHKDSAPEGEKRGGRAIDSDDEEEEAGVAEDGHLTEDKIEGQEEATIANDDGIAITPFNLREEMQEGYFDKTGCYIFNKEDKEIHDNWLDNVDWGSVKETKQQRPAGAVSGPGADGDSGDDSSSGSGDDLGPAELSRICTAARALLSPGGGETVAAAIKRLGGGANRALTASQRLRLRKAGRGGGGGGGASGADAEAAAANRQRMLELSELAGRLVSAGHMAAYQMDARQLAKLGGLGSVVVSAGEEGAATSSSSAASASGAGMDMFASDEEEAGEEASNKDQKSHADSLETKPPPTGSPAVAEVSWLYRVADSPEAETLGPFSSQQMLDWSEGASGFPGGHRVVFVRKVGTPEDAPFYSSARIDFDLYV